MTDEQDDRLLALEGRIKAIGIAVSATIDVLTQGAPEKRAEIVAALRSAEQSAGGPLQWATAPEIERIRTQLEG